MKQSYLIQRLKKPSPSDSIFADNPFAFGGGYKNGGLSDQAMNLLRDIFQFDYMGSAEFEFGAVPIALNAIAKQADAETLTSFAISIPLASVEKNWRDKFAETPTGVATVYVICHNAWKDEVKTRLFSWAADEHGPGHWAQFKEVPRFAAALRPVEDWHRDTCGWLELDKWVLLLH